MEFRILGPIDVSENGRTLALGGPKQRLVLAHLLLRANQVVSAEVLIDEVWGDETPDAALSTLRGYVSHLRKALGGDRLESRSSGYVLRGDPEEVDASRFERLVREARAVLAGDPAAAATLLREALSLWRGPAFADLAEEPSLRGEIARLEELRLAATEQRISAALALGRHTTVVGELEALTGRYPLRERLWAQLMTALYRTGRQGEALTAYGRARQVLVEELGIDPSPELQHLHEQILAQDPALGTPEPGPQRPPARTSRADLSPGTGFATYRIESILGRGGMSVVYLAEHQGLKRKVALKILSPQLAEDPRFRERFVRESQIAASIDHPNVIPIYEAGEAEGQLFIAMRYVEGTDLRALLHEEGKLEDGRTVSIVRQVAGALDAAHAQGLVHRDVKPGNILLARAEGSQAGEHVYLSDFGLTKRAASDSGVTGTGQFVGTLDYAAPEQFEGKSLTPRTDVYSLGCVLYECLAGHAPFRRDNDAAVMYAHLLEDPPALTGQHPSLPEEIDAVVANALAKKPDDRYQSAGELAAAAGAALGYETGLQSALVPASRRRKRRGSRRTWLIAATAGIVALAVVIAVLVTGPGGGKNALADIPSGMAIIDAKTGEEVGFIPRSVVKEPAEAIFADGHFWVLNLSPISFVEIDPTTGKILTEIASPFDDVGYFAVDSSTLWVTQYDGPGLSKVDIDLGREVDRFAIGGGAPNGTNGSSGVAVGAGSVWVGRPQDGDGHGRIGMLLRLDPESGRVEHRFLAQYDVYSVVFADGQVWTNGSGVSRIDPATNTVAAGADLSGTLAYVAGGGGFGWASDETKGVVYKIDQGGNVAATYPTGEGARVVSYSDGVLWVGNQDVGTVTGIDAVTGDRRSFRFEHPLQAIATGSGVVLVQLNPGRTYEDRIDTLKGNVAKLLVESYQLEGPDPATLWSFVGFQVEYATCAKLLNYPDAPAPEGSELQPEVAAAMPDVSADRRTYTFTIRDGYAFSPPSNEPVTAETFRYSIERALSPKIDGPGRKFVDDIEGESAFLAGRAEHISGLRAVGDTLAITLTEPSGDFLQRLALPFFCPVPTDTPIVAGGAVRGSVNGVGGGQTVPSAGPYYIADQFNGEYSILKRNPNYAGPRPHVFDAIALREGIDPGQAVSRVKSGAWDGITNVYDTLLDLGGSLAQQWGPASQAATGGDQRYFPTTWANTGFIAFNAGRPLFANPDVRRAAALALDRQALAAVYGQLPTDQLLPPGMPGYQDRNLFRLDTPDLVRAQALMRGRTGTAVMAVLPNCPTCVQEAQIVRADLGPIGIRVRIKEFANPFDAVRQPGAKIDLLDDGTGGLVADPASFLTQMLLEDMPTSWLPLGVQTAVEQVAGLTGSQRISQAAALSDRLATEDVPVAADGVSVIGEFFSPRLGCLTFPSFGYGVDLAALCVSGSS